MSTSARVHTAEENAVRRPRVTIHREVTRVDAMSATLATDSLAPVSTRVHSIIHSVTHSTETAFFRFFK